MAILFVHPRRGLFQLTKCQSCGYKFQCDNCENNLTTYRTFETNMQLVCSQCQSYYSYPVSCPKCGCPEVNSVFGGIDELCEVIKKEYSREVIKVDSKSSINWEDYSQGSITNQNTELGNLESRQETLFATTRLFDPSIDYKVFSKIVFIRAENILSSSDYLVGEEVHRSIAEVIMSVSSSCEVVFDTADPELEFFQDIAKLSTSNQDHISVVKWFSDFIDKEKLSREKFSYPPFENIILITTQEKTKEKSLASINSTLAYLKTEKLSTFQEIRLSSPYPAKFLKRKGYYSNHIIVRYPKKYPKYFQLQKSVKFLASSFRLQVRLNPRHLF